MTTPGSDQPAFGAGDPGSMPPPPSYNPGAGGGSSGPGVPAPRNGFGVAALVLGILAVVLCWTAIVGIVLGVLAIVFAILGMRRASRGVSTNRGMSIAGLVTGIVGLVIAVWFTIVYGSVLSFFGSNQFKDLQQCIQQAGGDQAKVQSCDQQFQQQFLQQQKNGG